MKTLPKIKTLSANGSTCFILAAFGATYVTMGKALGVTHQRARQLMIKHVQYIDHDHGLCDACFLKALGDKTYKEKPPLFKRYRSLSGLAR